MMEARTDGASSGVRVVHAERTRHQHGADARHESRRRDHPRPRGSGETVGRDRRHPPEGEDRRASSRGRRERHLCGERARPDALGRPARIRRRGRSRRFHLRAALRPPSGDQRAATTSRSPASWCAADRSRWSSISICRTSSRIRRRSSGSTTFIRPKPDEVQARPASYRRRTGCGSRLCQPTRSSSGIR